MEAEKSSWSCEKYNIYIVILLHTHSFTHIIPYRSNQAGASAQTRGRNLIRELVLLGRSSECLFSVKKEGESERVGGIPVSV